MTNLPFILFIWPLVGLGVLLAYRLSDEQVIGNAMAVALWAVLIVTLFWWLPWAYQYVIRELAW